MYLVLPTYTVHAWASAVLSSSRPARLSLRQAPAVYTLNMLDGRGGLRQGSPPLESVFLQELTRARVCVRVYHVCGHVCKCGLPLILPGRQGVLDCRPSVLRASPTRRWKETTLTPAAPRAPSGPSGSSSASMAPVSEMHGPVASGTLVWVGAACLQSIHHGKEVPKHTYSRRRGRYPVSGSDISRPRACTSKWTNVGGRHPSLTKICELERPQVPTAAGVMEEGTDCLPWHRGAQP